MITSTQLLSYLSSDAPMEIFGAESYVWSGCGVPSSGVEHGLVRGTVDQEQTVVILPVLYFFASSIHVLISPALWVVVKVAHYYKVGDFGADGIERQRFVVGAVEVHQLNVHIIRLDLHHLMLSLPCECLSDRRWCWVWEWWHVRSVRHAGRPATVLRVWLLLPPWSEWRSWLWAPLSWCTVLPSCLTVNRQVGPTTHDRVSRSLLALVLYAYLGKYEYRKTSWLCAFFSFLVFAYIVM